MDRSTIELVLPQSGAKVVMYEYMTTGDKRKIKRLALGATSVNVSGGETQMGTITGEVLADIEDVALKALIKQITTKDGTDVTDITTFIEELPSQDGDILYEKADEANRQSQVSLTEKKN